MASAELLKMTHCIDSKVMGVDDRVKGVEGTMHDVCDNIQEVHDEVQNVGDKVQNVDSRVQGVDDKLAQVNRTLFFSICILFRALRQLHRKPTQRKPFTMAFAPKSIHQS